MSYLSLYIVSIIATRVRQVDVCLTGVYKFHQVVVLVAIVASCEVRKIRGRFTFASSFDPRPTRREAATACRAVRVLAFSFNPYLGHGVFGFVWDGFVGAE